MDAHAIYLKYRKQKKKKKNANLFSLHNFILQTDDLTFYEMTYVEVDNMETGDNLDYLTIILLDNSLRPNRWV